MAEAAVRGSGAKIDIDMNDFPSGLQKEVAFLTEKRQKRKYEALEANQLLPSEVSNELQVEAREFQKRRAKHDRELDNERRLKHQKLAAKPLELAALRNKNVYISKRVSNDYDQACLNKQAENLGARVVQDMIGVDIFVVPSLDPERIGIKVLWTSMLLGCMLVMPTLLMGGPRAVLTFKAAVSFWRRVFITDGFKAKHPELVDVVAQACASPSSKWALLPGVQEYNKELKKAKQESRSGQVVILKRTKEEVQGVCSGGRAYDFKALQTSINKLDASRTSSG